MSTKTKGGKQKRLRSADSTNEGPFAKKRSGKKTDDDDDKNNKKSPKKSTSSLLEKTTIDIGSDEQDADGIRELLGLTDEDLAEPISILRKFNAIAEGLLNGCILYVEGRPFRLVEIEFYLRHKSQHDDIFVHGCDDQKTLGRWYFHKQRGSYKGGTFKGLDLSFGTREYPAGILIRSIEDLTERDLVEGSCNVVDKILSCTGSPSIAHLVKRELAASSETKAKLPLSAFQSKGLYLTKDAHGILSKLPNTIYHAPRVGLTLRDDAGAIHVMRPYRKSVCPSLSKMRVGFVLSLYHFHNVKATDTIAAITKAQKSSIKNSIQWSKDGTERANSDSHHDFFAKPMKNIGDFSKLFGDLLAKGHIVTQKERTEGLVGPAEGGDDDDAE